jgi:AcrR family transcriptional regulator
MAQKDTARSILDAAEELFSERGFAETSLRNITTKADVNLAAVNYHFGSKKSLIQAVFARFLTPFVAELDKALNTCDAEHGEQPADLMSLLRLLSDTALRSGADRPERLRIFMRLLGLAYSQGQGHVRRFLRVEYGHVFRRYSDLLTRATPELSDEDRFWRVHFMLGATMFTLNGVDSLTAMAEHDFGKPTATPDVIDQLLPFLASGLKSPAGN